MALISSLLAIAACGAAFLSVLSARRVLRSARVAVEALAESSAHVSHVVWVLASRYPNGHVEIPADEWAEQPGELSIIPLDDGSVRVLAR